MFESILPRSMEQGYRGHPVARWVLLGLTLITLVRSLIHMFKYDGGAHPPLHSPPPRAPELELVVAL